MEQELNHPKPCMSRRDFLLFGGKAVASTMVLLSLPGLANGQQVPAQFAEYPRKIKRNSTGRACLLQISFRG